MYATEKPAVRVALIKAQSQHSYRLNILMNVTVHWMKEPTDHVPLLSIR